MKYTGPKAKLTRRLGINLFGADKYDKIMAKKPYGPGKDPKVRQGRDSEYAKQLKEKQKARIMYGLSEKQFSGLYAQALKAKGRTGDQMKQLLEMRLDNFIYRAGFAMTRMQSRQFAAHGLFLVDGQRVTTPSFRVQPGQKITIRKQAKDSPVFTGIRDHNEKYLAPKWIKADSTNLSAEVIAIPDAGDAEHAVDMDLVIGYYSRK